MKNQFKLIFVLVTGLLMSSGNAFAISAERLEQFGRIMTDEITQLMDEGKTLKEAAAITAASNSSYIKKDPAVSEAIYGAISTVAATQGISTGSPQFSAAIGATSEILINELGVSEGTVAELAVTAGIDVALVADTLPATAAGRPAAQASPIAGIATSGFTAPQNLGSVISNAATSGGNAGSPAS
jgi:hypothetical protein